MNLSWMTLLGWMATLFVLTNANEGETNIYLTKDNYDAETAGKTVFVRFVGPRCPKCRTLDYPWGNFANAANYDGADKLVATIDCEDTEGGLPLCQLHNVTTYPRFKWGNPKVLDKEYTGEQHYGAFLEFLHETMKAECGPVDLDLCTDDERAKITKYQAMTTDELEQLIRDTHDAMKQAQLDFKTTLDEMSDQYYQAYEKKEETIEAILKGEYEEAKRVQMHKQLGSSSDAAGGGQELLMEQPACDSSGEEEKCTDKPDEL